MTRLPVLTALSILAACCACSTPTASAVGRQTPKNAAELVQQYQAQTGFNITYDERTAELLESIAVSQVGEQELNVIRLEARSVASAKEAAAPVFEVISLQYSEASPLAATLTDLIQSAAGDGTEPGIKILTDPRTNSLLVMAPPEHLEKLKALVATLDKDARTGG